MTIQQLHDRLAELLAKGYGKYDCLFSHEDGEPGDAIDEVSPSDSGPIVWFRSE
jgi:hypothetical protein